MSYNLKVLIMGGQGRKRRSTFSNIASLETHGVHVKDESLPVSDTIPENTEISKKDGDSSETQKSTGHDESPGESSDSVKPRPVYYQITSNRMQLIDDTDDASLYQTNSREHGSASSVESQGELLDHRQGSAPRIASKRTQHRVRGEPYSSSNRHRHTFEDSSSPNVSSFSGRSPMQKKFAQNIVNRWVRRRSSISREPLIGSNMADYDAISDQEYAIDMNDDDGDDNIGSDEERRFVDIMSDEEPLDSEPSSRRNSDASSLRDVCFPLDSSQEDDSLAGDIKIWPDLNLLNEFAEEEIKEIEEIERSLESEESQQNSGGRSKADTPFVGPTYTTVNEAEVADGRLRPRRMVPWASYQKSRRRSKKPELYIPGMDEKAASQMRFAYFREDMDATIHSPNISGLISQPGTTFTKLFPPRVSIKNSELPPPTFPGAAVPQRNALFSQQPEALASSTTGTSTPVNIEKLGTSSPRKRTPSLGNSSQSPGLGPTADRATAYDPNQVDPVPFWLDVCNPTEDEMRVISKAFGIHPLTIEDIFTGENREKVELFKNYYFVCFRCVDVYASRKRHRDQESNDNKDGKDDQAKGRKDGFSLSGSKSSSNNLVRRKRRESSDNHSTRRLRKYRSNNNDLRSMNMYIIVFHEGVITFHFSPSPNPMNVRRRTRLLQDYMTVSSDWLSYALIDDIVDGFQPLMEAIEQEVNDIEEEILRLHSGLSDSDEDDSDDDESDDDSSSSTATSSSKTTANEAWRKKGDMLRRIGECRKRVMGMLRLLSNKPDVIRGFSKRCNERWEVAPRNEIGLYLGDIQDHVVTMVQSLNHYEKLLARSHSNYLAQINIDMTKVNNDLNDVLSKITVLGTMVLPLNIVTGLWGMNVQVPGQFQESLVWFWAIVGSMGIFALLCFYWTRRFL